MDSSPQRAEQSNQSPVGYSGCRPTPPAQAEAIACLDEPLQIIACAGSGKTQVISQRIASILSLPGVEPRNIVAFTFTEKAAAELQDRIYSILEQEGVDRLGLAEMYVGTMHGYALDLLQRLVPETFKFSVLTDITVAAARRQEQQAVRPDRLPDQLAGTPYPAALPPLAGSSCRRRASSARTPSTGTSCRRAWCRRSATT